LKRWQPVATFCRAGDPTVGRQCHNLHCTYQEWHKRGGSSPQRDRGPNLPGSPFSTTHRQHPKGVRQNADMLGMSSFGSELSGHRPRHREGNPVGGNVQLPAHQGLHTQPNLTPQPASRRSDGNEAQWRVRQHNHESWTVDITDLPHLHSLADWNAHSRPCMADVQGIHLPECGVTMMVGSHINSFSVLVLEVKGIKSLGPPTTSSSPWHRSTNQLGCTSQQHDGIWPLDTEGFALGPVGSTRCKLDLAMTVGSGHLTRSLCTKCSCITTLSNNDRYAKGSSPVVSTPDRRTRRTMLCLAVLLP
jgi:hypothetical protein